MVVRVECPGARHCGHLRHGPRRHDRRGDHLRTPHDGGPQGARRLARRVPPSSCWPGRTATDGPHSQSAQASRRVAKGRRGQHKVRRQYPQRRVWRLGAAVGHRVHGRATDTPGLGGRLGEPHAVRGSRCDAPDGRAREWSRTRRAALAAPPSRAGVCVCGDARQRAARHDGTRGHRCQGRDRRCAAAVRRRARPAGLRRPTVVVGHGAAAYARRPRRRCDGRQRPRRRRGRA
mmetsp:Transcript_12036/g.50639  ORF Transcript_12036/g.50639 Transcript_12036/m.50639 type:complete len:233 (-) Transcript_12036:704-1402(-)